VNLLLVNKADVNLASSDGTTALHAAAGMGHKDVAELLLANQAKVDAVNMFGNTPLHYAASAGHKDMVELLLAHHANINARTGPALYRGDKNALATPLDAAELNDHEQLGEWLRQHGA